ncbi:extracellular solute-binding protein [Pseudothermotoga sp.]
MRKLCGVALLIVAAVLLAQANIPIKVTLTMMVAGDQNMVDFFQYEIAPEFEKLYPNVKVKVVGTGPGDAGSQQIIQQLQLEKDSGKDKWAIDLVVIHEAGTIWAIERGLIRPYTDFLTTRRLVTMKTAEVALGVNVNGYVMPMFHSQTAIAYNPRFVKDPPKSYAELVEWVKKNPKKFGYNGIKGGMSGVSFVFGWVYWKSKNPDVLMNGPFDEKYMEDWPQIYAELKEFNKYVTLTAGNAGTLDALNRGEIWMGPVWVDMFYTWIREGRMDPNIRLILPEPGMPGQPMYFAIPTKAANADYALKLIEFVTSPAVHAKYIVDRFNWYPAIGVEYVTPHLGKEVFERLYRDIKEADLLKFGKRMPIADYRTRMLEAYERWVEK